MRAAARYPSGGRFQSRLLLRRPETTLIPAFTVHDAAELRTAVESAQPGARILLAPGSYPGGFYFANLRGETNLPIVIAAADPQNPPVIQGAQTGCSSPTRNTSNSTPGFAGQPATALNIDDGGSFDTPARHLVCAVCGSGTWAAGQPRRH